MTSGIIILDKPAGWTSFDAVHKLRNLLHARRVGHGGTLDPMATGVLPVFVGRATRAVELFEAADKTYLAGLQLGVITDTEDTTGTVLERRPVAVTEAQLRAAVAALIGAQEQVPPMYSAIKVDGKRLYALARKGKEVARKPRPITVYEAELLSFSGDTAQFRVRCSKGTYIRSLCRDLGERLGCGGCMCALRRTQAGVYTAHDAVSLDTVAAADDPWSLLRPVDSMFADLPAYTASAAQTIKIRNGVAVPGDFPEGRCRVYDPDGAFLMLGEQKDGTLGTIKSFFEVI
ncbi:MAG: tRNA pseudouridine(55) synthase TruB [Oscillospiraceae bacterium]|nr:tRNA pseudouridine(55) synthase TruB [Oscillospiraceae bacterium]